MGTFSRSIRPVRSRRIAALTGVVLVVAACGGAGSDADEDDGGIATTEAQVEPTSETAAEEAETTAPVVAGPVRIELIPPTPPDVTVSGLEILRGGSGEGAPEPLVELDEIRSGGPPPDGIPSIDEPTFVSPSDVDFLEENEPVLALDIDGDLRAYPVQILIWHEIVNDTVGGIPVAVTYCPAVQLGGCVRPTGRRPGDGASAPRAACGTRRS